MILADAAAYPLVIVAGDMNSHGIGKEFVANGFVWPTEHNGFTTAFFNWDHVFLKGFHRPGEGGAPDQPIHRGRTRHARHERPRPRLGRGSAPLSSATLVIQTAFLGDVVLTTPLLSALAADHGPVDVVTTPLAAPLLETHPAVRKVIAYDKRGSDRGWRGLRKLAQRLRAEQYQRAYLPHRSLRTCGAGETRPDSFPDRVFGRVVLPLYRGSPQARLGHESDRLLALANEPPGAYRPQLRPTAADEQAAAALIDGAFVALAPGSIWAVSAGRTIRNSPGNSRIMPLWLWWVGRTMSVWEKSSEGRRRAAGGGKGRQCLWEADAATICRVDWTGQPPRHE